VLKKSMTSLYVINGYSMQIWKSRTHRELTQE
jgi:hypothetical protein